MNFQTKRVLLFLRLVGRRDGSGHRLYPASAWRLAGIATGQIAAMPDSVIEWWWKIQDLRPEDPSRKPSTSDPAPEPRAKAAKR